MAHVTRPRFIVVKLFTGGILDGLTVTEETTVEFPVGFESCRTSGFGSPYRVIACRPA